MKHKLDIILQFKRVNERAAYTNRRWTIEALVMHFQDLIIRRDSKYNNNRYSYKLGTPNF